LRRVLALVTVTALFALAGGSIFAAPALAATPIQISSDPYTNTDSQHATQVEPDTYSFGSTIVATFQSGRYFDGGSSNIGVSVSKNGGQTWTPIFLPGTTDKATPPGIYPRASDPSVAYDPKHNVWIVSMLGLTSGSAVDVIASRSLDGGTTWQNPVVVNASGRFNDKNWTTCDTTPSSPFYGNCYTQWDDASLGNLMQMSTSTDGGATWGPAKATANHESGVIGGQPVVMSNGKVVVPFDGNFGIEAFNSTDGGNTWSTPVHVASMSYHIPAGGLRAPDLPTAEVRNPGPVVVAWADCRFEPSCSANDIVFTTSSDGVTWGSVRRIPLDPVGSGIDHFIPGIAIQGPTLTLTLAPHLALGYYYYSNANCTFATCQLNVGFSFSNNVGMWSPPQKLAGPMQLAWLASTNQGRMVGDYISTSYSGTNAFTVYANAVMPTPPPAFNESMYTTPEAAQAQGQIKWRQASAAGAHSFPHYHVPKINGLMVII
jgi:BNR repeat-like domain